NIKETLQKIEIESKNKLNSTNNTIKLNIHNENKQFVEESLVFLENLELQMESERRASIFQSGSVLEQTDIRKEIYLKHINTFSQLEEYFRANNKYEVYTTELTALRTENYDSITEQLLQNYNSINSTKRDLFSLFSTKQEAIPFVDLINDLCDKFPENLDHLKNIETRMHAAFSSENVHLKTEISEKEKREIISSFLSRNEFGSFFRTIHRIIKIILSFSILKRPKTINKYLGILRTQLSEEQLLLLFYNAEYTKRGEKFKKNVSNVNLWGDLDELDTSDDKEPTHFKSSALIWPENDLKILRTKYVKK
ncbi:putative phage abortive infection protein, partial [Latilactobacillus curvatus]|uniref:putative phage abortive infection protein n=1 Tax=Latilactobacillus curvatus TaxID=28038 RepID=UPI00240EBC6B